MTDRKPTHAAGAIRQWLQDHQTKVVPPEALTKTIDALRKQNKKIVTVNGSFDLLHAGHLQILYEGKQLGDILLVALNSDSSIQRYKSPDRPIIPLSYRIQMMTALQFVDLVTWFDETDPRSLLKEIKPDIHVNGSEYGANCIEAETVHKGGGSIHIASHVEGLSTSRIIKKIHSLCD